MTYSSDQIRWSGTKPPRGADGGIEIPLRVAADWQVDAAIAVGSNVGAGRWYNDTGYTLKIQTIRLGRKTTGSSGFTTIDVNMNDVTLYTTQGNRPSVRAGSDDVTSLGTAAPDVTSVAPGDFLSVDIDEAEAGTPKGLRVSVLLSIG